MWDACAVSFLFGFGVVVEGVRSSSAKVVGGESDYGRRDGGVKEFG